MLIICIECGLQVSDKAVTCPHCGYPLKPEAARKYQRKKRKRLPNGFGQISELKGRNLRNPFRAMVTVGKTEEGKPICKLLEPRAFFPTYNDAYAALVEHNKNPYNFDANITLEQVYNQWLEKKLPTASKSFLHTTRSVWKHCEDIKGMPIADMRTRHIKMCIESPEKALTPQTKIRIKTLMNQIFDYAVEYEMVDRNYAKQFSIPKEVHLEGERNRKEHIPYTDAEMNIMWSNAGDTMTDIVLVQCYTGFRPQELCMIETANVNITAGFIVGGMKTDAGTNRMVPIHSRIEPIIKKYYAASVASESKCLFPEYKYYELFRTNFIKMVQALRLNPEHRGHDGRKHFVTQAKKYKVDEYAIKYIVGHTIQDITERVYTKRELVWLKEEIEKIK